METHSRSPFSTTAPLSIRNLEPPSKLLQGWTLAVKDVIDVAKLPTGAGNPTWAQTHEVPTQHADVVNDLLNAGAEIIFKTITDELAYSLNGQNIHFPALQNCLDKDRLCGGSTSGSAVAVGSSKVRIGLGTDTGGSIRVPASYNNLVGFRPTHNLVGRKGVVPLAPGFDTVGWITQNINDAIQVGEVLLPDEPERSLVLEHPVKLSSLSGICDFQSEFNGLTVELFTKALCSCDVLSEHTMEIAAEAFRTLQGREIWQQHGQWITENNPVFAEDVGARFEWASKLTKEQELEACDQQQRFNQQLNQYLCDGQFIVLPTTPGAAPLINEDKQKLALYRNRLMMFTCAAGLSGCPQLHLPVFKHGNKAYGISLIGPRNSDKSLLILGREIMDKRNGSI